MCNARAAAPWVCTRNPRRRPSPLMTLPKEELGSVKEEPSARVTNDSEQGDLLITSAAPDRLLCPVPAA